MSRQFELMLVVLWYMYSAQIVFTDLLDLVLFCVQVLHRTRTVRRSYIPDSLFSVRCGSDTQYCIGILYCVLQSKLNAGTARAYVRSRVRIQYSRLRLEIQNTGYISDNKDTIGVQKNGTCMYFATAVPYM